MPVTVKQRRTRVTKKDKEAARKQLTVQSKPTRPKVAVEGPRYKRDFSYGLVYCDSNGYASIIGDGLNGVWLGKTDEFIPYLKSKGIDGENADRVLQALQQFRSEKESYSCHLAMESNAVRKNTRGTKSIVATFKKDPHFLRLLKRLISQGLGIRAIRSELKGQGYPIPMRTLGRWIREHRATL